MALKWAGRQTVFLQKPPVIASSAAVAGPKEGRGPLGAEYDLVLEDLRDGQKCWERAETRMLSRAVQICLDKVGLKPNDIQFFIAGDLLNQITCANAVARDLSIPFVGIYGACSTLAEGMAIGSMLIDGGFAERVMVATSSHHNTAERQYRYPTEFGAQRTPASQWTVTGAGAFLLAAKGTGPRVTHATVGSVVDMGMKDVNDMGSAMAPAAASTIRAHFTDTGRTPADYDVVLTGDLASVGKALCDELLKQQGLDLSGRYEDCGLMVLRKDQDVHAGASGCACSALVLSGRVLKLLEAGKYRRVLMVATGALHSPLTYQQGESIPCIAHGIAIERVGDASARDLDAGVKEEALQP
ncbi:MAG: stage V sporulation protein AD [Firmicutes bacterium]|nr:stage V sporulation protein AD [Bacillota bacterium]